MTVDAISTSSRALTTRIPIVSEMARQKGWAYVLSWGHRLSGLLLVGYVLFHVYTLNLLRTPEAYDAEMRLLSNPFFVFLEWALAVPVVLHAFNGGRILLYELFGRRDDRAMITWALVMTAAYALFLGLLMILGDQAASPVFYWLLALILAAVATIAVGRKVWPVPHSLTWKLQRMTAAFLLVVIPAHMILAHLNLAFSHEAAQVTTRMQSGFVKLTDSLILLALAYHAAYALTSLARDYLGHKALRFIAIVVILAVMVYAAYFGLSLTMAV